MIINLPDRRFVLALAICLLSLVSPAIAADQVRPNIVLILADDMGYGDIGAYNSESKIPTPHLDSLAAQGMRFTDMHAAASWCQPSRYGLMTGRYPWRDRVAKGLPKRPRGHVINHDMPTLGTVLRDRGYHTAYIGKWHLGLGKRGEKYDLRKDVPVPMGPNDLGFDTSYILPGSLDFGPYVFLKNQAPIATPSEKIEGRDWPAKRRAMGEFWRRGSGMPGFDFRQVLPHWQDKAVAHIHAQQSDRPFFLFLSLTAPHTPWMPTAKFKGRSGAGMYGDFVTQVDDVVGKVMAALDKANLAEDTVILFTSDNGPYWVAAEEKEFKHEANGVLRGQKNDAWEGGHRMPFIARWPKKTPAGSTSNSLLCFTDLMATFATLAGKPLPDSHSAIDSHDASSALLGTARGSYTIRSTLALVAGRKIWFRERDWKAIPFLGSGGNSEPKKRRSLPGEPKGQLYNLREDIGETRNRYLAEPAIVESLRQRWKAMAAGAPLGGI